MSRTHIEQMLATTDREREVQRAVSTELHALAIRREQHRRKMEQSR